MQTLSGCESGIVKGGAQKGEEESSMVCERSIAVRCEFFE